MPGSTHYPTSTAVTEFRPRRQRSGRKWLLVLPLILALIGVSTGVLYALNTGSAGTPAPDMSPS
ncbi:hypothetical protein [Nocardia carnea]|uniref:hypothetical protein n=1 Tax=Nocardia carnea TaxID=37328 RepID=UPI002453FF40|nr:hypothetical protein [Nocardia carnea]